MKGIQNGYGYFVGEVALDVPKLGVGYLVVDEYRTWVIARVRYFYFAVNILPVYVKNNARGLMPPIA